MSKDLLDMSPKFPCALVPGAKSVEEVLNAWKDAGLNAVEVSEEDLISEIKIEVAKHTGELKWSVEKADGLRAMSIMTIVMKSMYQEYLKDGGRHKLAINSTDTKIAIQLDSDTVQMAYDQTQDPMVIKGLLIACLWRMIDQCDDGHPLDVFSGLLQFDIEEEI